MATKESKAVSTQVSEETLAALRESYPVEPMANRITLPRIQMASQDKTKETGTGKNKKIEVITAAGTFSISEPTDDEDPETGKKIWKNTEIGDSFKGIILFQRKQLRMFDDNVYTSSPVYDNDDEQIPLWRDGQEIARGTPAELKSSYQFKDPNTGKVKSKLEENRILYVKNIEDDNVYQLSLRSTSMFAFFKYGKKVLVPAVVTEFGSEPKENGAISWNQMTFKVDRKLNQKELEEVLEGVRGIKTAIAAEKSQYANSSQVSESNAQMVELVEKSGNSKGF